MATELAKVYDPKLVEPDVSARWQAVGAFNANGHDAVECVLQRKLQVSEHTMRQRVGSQCPAKISATPTGRRVPPSTNNALDALSAATDG